MFAKSILFTSLLVCSFSTFLNAKSSDASDHDSSHLLDGVFDDLSHAKKLLFVSAAKQLKSGKFREKSSPRGMLLHGPYKEGKNEMVEAMITESNCHILRVKASELVNRYQGSGAGAIRSIFDQAKILKADKGVIILIEELESLSPETTKDARCSSLAHEHRLALAQLRWEHDENKSNRDPILIVATCSNLALIDEGTRDRLRCIKFSYPDRMGADEILKHKLITFFRGAETYISNSMRNKKCYAMAIKKKH